MIDWNRARKRLRRLVGPPGGDRAAAVGRRARLWAHRVPARRGRRARLRRARVRRGPGRRAPASRSRTCSVPRRRRPTCGRCCGSARRALLAGKPVSLVQDEVRAELTGYLRSARQEILALALRHAELSVEIAEAARDALEQAIVGAAGSLPAPAARAQRAEHEADELRQRGARRRGARARSRAVAGARRGRGRHRRLRRGGRVLRDAAAGRASHRWRAAAGAADRAARARRRSRSTCARCS